MTGMLARLAVLAQLDQSEGREIGLEPTVTILDAATATKFGTTNAKDDIDAFLFD